MFVVSAWVSLFILYLALCARIYYCWWHCSLLCCCSLLTAPSLPLTQRNCCWSAALFAWNCTSVIIATWQRVVPFHLGRQLPVAGITSDCPLPSGLLFWALCLVLMMLQWNALDNTLTLFISVWIAAQWLPEGNTWVPLPNLCHRAEDFNCQASSSSLPLPWPLSVFSFWLTISLFRLVSFVVQPPLCHYSKCQCHFWVFYHFFLFWFFGFSPVFLDVEVSTRSYDSCWLFAYPTVPTPLDAAHHVLTVLESRDSGLINCQRIYAWTAKARITLLLR